MNNITTPKYKKKSKPNVSFLQNKDLFAFYFVKNHFLFSKKYEFCKKKHTHKFNIKPQQTC